MSTSEYSKLRAQRDESPNNARLTPDPDFFSGDEDQHDDGRPSAEMASHDRELLDEEEERETLLSRGGATGKFPALFRSGKSTGDPVKIGGLERKRLKRQARRERKGARNGESSELMYEMEEGVGRSDSELSSRNSSQSDQQRLEAVLANKKARRSRIWRRVLIHSSIVVLFLVILFVAYRASKRSSVKYNASLLSNGTHSFAPTTILISLDGFRADFLYRGLTPTLTRFVQGGISPKYMMPSFPSVTFPNHYTMVTGLYPEAHGIVGNTFWDVELQKEFYYTDPDKSLQPFWWGGEPVWLTAEKQGVRTAIHMWPGSEAHIGDIQPAHVDKYNGSEVLSRKTDRIFEFLDLPGPDSPAAKADLPRPQLIAAYVPVVDADGHQYGPNSTEIRQTIMNVDDMLEQILQGLQQRNLTEVVNVVVVSDHGMATTDVERLIQLEDLIEPEELEHIDGWPLYGLRPKKPEDLDRLHKQLQEKAKTNPNIEVYLRDKDMPERYHFSQSERIAPLWIVPNTGWAIVTKDEFDVEQGKLNGDVYHPRGLHGYDHEHPLMRAIFVARGPAFPHKPNSRLEPFQNIELYNIVCDSIGIEPKPNNGTMRLPLKPAGLHSDPSTPENETPADPVGSPASSAMSPSAAPVKSISRSTTVAAVGVTSGVPETPVVGATPTSDVQEPSAIPAMPSVALPTMPPPAPPSTPVANPTEEPWWEWVHDKIEDVEEWVDDLLHPSETPPNGGHGGAYKPDTP
ncbi:Phosphodiest-domain-containing protein [Mytilinidion resinicola]|uniref:Phosphodiest-domain-containing protein n=1 Tax=Mytilinidion resinicola TaxID=574789 RepID=A0A6A6YCQ6_9PEZI|nr:Phosphodiest-domain-containing protein [Mytilinidion resinicola]KAF2806616.1 Phosphodiest-domain-containing protein [Mytilinidion resinicola]